MASFSVCIVTPALASANNGNWQTASRWARLLRNDYRVRLTDHWPHQDDAGGTTPDLLIALHARRSAASIEAFARAHPERPLVVVLTGTDLYRDIHHDESARRSLAFAHRLVVLHERAIDDLPADCRGKAVVCFQSTPARRTLAKPRSRLRALMVGHLREEKSPETFFEAARLLKAHGDIRLDHIGSALDPALGAQAQALAAECPTYRWLGALPHSVVRRHIQEAHVLVHPSLMEGGAHVVMEAVRSGTPVLASRISGNVGMLGSNYPGYFEPGDAHGLAQALERLRDQPAILTDLAAQCDARAPLFDSSRERATLRALLSDLLETRP